MKLCVKIVSKPGKLGPKTAKCDQAAESHCPDGPGCMRFKCWKLHHTFKAEVSS
jgi:hypothetical protein